MINHLASSEETIPFSVNLHLLHRSTSESRIHHVDSLKKKKKIMLHVSAIILGILFLKKKYAKYIFVEMLTWRF